MLVAIVVIFFFCWAPRLSWGLATALSRYASGTLSKLSKYITAVTEHTINYSLIIWSYFNSAANAPVYYLMSK